MFDMKADMRHLFNWNTKLVFIYVTAEYETQINGLNQIVIWDYIIEDLKVKGSQFLFLQSSTRQFCGVWKSHHFCLTAHH